jgi:hypothetical protein
MKTKTIFNILSICSILIAFGCNSKSSADASKSLNTATLEQNDKQVAASDKYVGNWIDINRDPNDTSEIFTITKLHDYEYKLGPLSGQLKDVDENGVKKAEYLSIWSQEYGVEIQFIYDSYTKHLLMRTPMFSKELRKI